MTRSRIMKCLLGIKKKNCAAERAVIGNVSDDRLEGFDSQVFQMTEERKSINNNDAMEMYSCWAEDSN